MSQYNSLSEKWDSKITRYFGFCQYGKFGLIVQCKSFKFSATEDYCLLINIKNALNCGSASSVVIATGYNVDGMEIVSLWEHDFPHPCRSALTPMQHSVQWGFCFLWVKRARGMKMFPHHSSSVVTKCFSYTSIAPTAKWRIHKHISCSTVHLFFKK
jgi:hypothetical protein